MLRPYERACRDCGRLIDLQYLAGRWRAFNPDGSPHRCRQVAARSEGQTPRNYGSIHTPRHQSRSNLLWAVLALVVLGLIGYAVIDGAGDKGKQRRSDPQQASAPSLPGVPRQELPQSEPNRADCAAIRGTEYQSETERDWFFANCFGQTLLPIPADAQSARVVRIIDGDTIDVVLDGVARRIRYYGVDTPEQDQACFSEATERNRALAGTNVLLLPDARNTDPYGRLLRYVLTPDGVFIDAELVAEGYGRAWRSDGTYRSRIIGLEGQASQQHMGCLWR
jgi:endonuclease YncB( thermonuclease family)